MSIPIDDFPTGSPVSIVSTIFTAGNVGTPYFEYLDASGGYPPYVWSLSSGTLPTGLSVDSSGFISGIPTVAGTYSFDIQVEDLINGTDNESFSIVINAATAPTITTTSLPPVQVGTVYSQTIVATGGTPPYTTWAITTGTLPPGLSLGAGTGIISGTPTTAGTYNFIVEVTDTATATDVQAFSLIIQSLTPTITTTSLSSGTTGIAYSTNINATGGTTPYTNWQITAGTLPTGLLLSSFPTNGQISGIPTSSGTFVFTVEVTDSGSAVDTQILSLTINNGSVPTIYTSSLPFAPLSTLYSTTINASGGALPYTWSLESGHLPFGLSLDPLTGIISGTPTVEGSYLFTIKVKDFNNNTDQKLFSITVGNYILPAITNDLLPSGITGTAYYINMQGIGGQLPYTWGTLGLLPTGLTLDTNTGVISGTPTVAGTYAFFIILMDDASNLDIHSFTIIIGDGTLPLITTTSIPNGNLDIAYTTVLSALGGTPGYTWGLSVGSLPLGLSLLSNGIITGTPTVIGSYTFTVEVTDANSDTDTQVLTMIIRSTGFDSDCCFCVFTEEIVEFTSNSTDGVLLASGGTILSNTKWQAPSVEGVYDVIIEVDGVNGKIQSKNIITVVKKLKVTNIEGNLDYLLPGDLFEIETNYPKDQVVWTTVGCDRAIITPSGNITITTSVADKCYGSLDCIVRGTLAPQPDCSLDDYVDVRVIVNPVYPTPDNCGPYISKWLRESPEFSGIITEFEGGCDESHVRNKVPIYRWSINYEGLKNYKTSDTICGSCQKCINICGCDYISPHSTGDCHPILRSANRIDDFWNLVYGQFKKFTLIDHDTQEIWYNVRFEDRPSYDHAHRRNSNSRSVKLVWKPCCNRAPAGGTCSKHGMFNYKPERESCSNSTCIGNDDLLYVNIIGLVSNPDGGYYEGTITFNVEGNGSFEISHIDVNVENLNHQYILGKTGEVTLDTTLFSTTGNIDLIKIEVIINDIYGNVASNFIIIPISNTI